MPASVDPICRVLVIDDNQAIHDDINKILQNSAVDSTVVDELASTLFETPLEKQNDQKFEIDSAFQGQDGYRMAQKAFKENVPYRIAIVDMRMPPGWDGIETISNLWKLDPLLQVVICTAFSDRSWANIIECLGQTDALLILKKPFDTIELLQTVQALSCKWALHQKVHSKLNNLETTVLQRTEDLKEINEKLKAEIDERIKAEEGLKHLATHDALTGLANRTLLTDRLNQSLVRARRSGKLAAMLLLDLDHFKDVNDLHGHACGDRLLTEISERLKSCARECDTVARLGGDEFVVLLPDMDSPAKIEVVTQRIIDAFRKPFSVSKTQIRITPSIGISIFPIDSEDPEFLTKAADIAMYRAKNEGRGTYRFFTDESADEADRQEQLSCDLEVAAENNELELRYQPLFDLQSGKTVFMEALVRWRHPERGLLNPMEFLSIAERTGSIIRIDDWVLQSACEQNKLWEDEGLTTKGIAVNLSMKQFHQSDLVEKITKTLQETKSPPEQLVLEITESTIMRNFSHSRTVLHQLSDLGIRVIIDDFGSGTSSVKNLSLLPLFALKIDPYFLKNWSAHKQNTATIVATIALAHALHVQMIVEGVETEEQLEFLKSLKGEFSKMEPCNMIQGFLFGKPTPADQATKYLSESFSGFALSE